MAGRSYAEPLLDFPWPGMPWRECIQEKLERKAQEMRRKLIEELEREQFPFFPPPILPFNSQEQLKRERYWEVYSPFSPPPPSFCPPILTFNSQKANGVSHHTLLPQQANGVSHHASELSRKRPRRQKSQDLDGDPPSISMATPAESPLHLPHFLKRPRLQDMREKSSHQSYMETPECHPEMDDPSSMDSHSPQGVLQHLKKMATTGLKKIKDLAQPVVKRIATELEEKLTQGLRLLESLLTSGSTKSADYAAIIDKHFRDLYKALSQLETLQHVAVEAFSRGLATSGVLNKVMTGPDNPQTKSYAFLKAVQERVRADPQAFHTFLDVLRSEAALHYLADRLEPRGTVAGGVPHASPPSSTLLSTA